MIKSRRMRWAWHVAHVGTREVHITFWCDSQKEEDHLEDQDVGEKIIKYILDRMGWNGLD
jgi:hypothetical protein